MGGINFLGNNKKSDIKENSVNIRKNDGNFEWTKPEKPATSGGNPKNTKNNLSNNRNLAPVEEENGGSENMDGKNSGDNELLNTGKNPSQGNISGGFLSRFFNLGRSRKKENLANDDLINRKQAITDLGKAVYEERAARKNNKFNGDNDQVASQNRDEESIDQRSKIKNSGVGFASNRWQAPQILKTDLIKDELTIFIDWKKNLSYLFINLFLVLIISIIAYIGFRYWGQSTFEQVRAIDKEILDLGEKINSFSQEKAEIDSSQKKLSILSKALAGHIYWTNFFSYLEKDTLADVYYTGGFKGDLTGKFSFGARANKFEDISNQVRVLKADQEFVNSVEVNQGALAEDVNAGKSRAGFTGNSIEFQMDLTIKPEILYKK